MREARFGLGLVECPLQSKQYMVGGSLCPSSLINVEFHVSLVCSNQIFFAAVVVPDPKQ